MKRTRAQLKQTSSTVGSFRVIFFEVRHDLARSMSVRSGANPPKIWKRAKPPPLMCQMLLQQSLWNGHGTCLFRTASGFPEWCLWSCSRQCLGALKCLNVLGTQERWDACQMLMSRQRDLLSQAELISETCRNCFSSAILQTLTIYIYNIYIYIFILPAAA